jgi:hypothetical protein
MKGLSKVTARLCASTGATLTEFSHCGAAARPRLLETRQRTQAAVCTMGARGGKLRDGLELVIRAESGSTLMVDSVMPVNLLPAASPSSECGIGIHASAESDSLLVITPEAHVPHREANAGIWTRYDLSPLASLISVQLADLHHQADLRGGGRYTCHTRVHHSTAAATVMPQVAPPEWSADGAGDFMLDNLGEGRALSSTSSCGLVFDATPSWGCDWTYGRRFQGLVMGTPATNVIASVILSGPRAAPVVKRFAGIEACNETHRALGLLGQAHLALQQVSLPTGELVVARVATEHREDMHRLLHHALLPLEPTLGLAPYSRKLLASSTVRAAAEPHAEASMPQMVHVQHANVIGGAQQRADGEWQHMRAFA